ALVQCAQSRAEPLVEVRLIAQLVDQLEPGHDDARVPARELEPVDRTVLARQADHALDAVVGVEVEQVADEQAAGWLRDGLQRRGGLHDGALLSLPETSPTISEFSRLSRTRAGGLPRAAPPWRGPGEVGRAEA